MNKMKIITKWSMVNLVLCCLATGCSQGPDLTGNTIVSGKTTYENGATMYYLKDNAGVRGKGSGTVKFIAHVNFANVGDKIVFIDNSLVAVAPASIK
jgi:hypothetical protein